MDSSYIYSLESMVHGYHVYQEIWADVVGEVIQCVRETGNHQDPFAVAVVKSSQTVGHLPSEDYHSTMFHVICWAMVAQ